MPALLTQCRVGRSGDAKTLGDAKPRTCKYPRGRASLDLLMPSGQCRPGLVIALGAGQVWTCQCSWAGHAWTYAKSHKSLVNSPRLNRVLFQPGSLRTCQLVYIPSTLNMPTPLGLESIDRSTALQLYKCVRPTLVVM